MYLSSSNLHGRAPRGQVGAFALVVVSHALREFVGDADLEGMVGALKNKAVEHCRKLVALDFALHHPMRGFARHTTSFTGCGGGGGS